MSRIPFICPVPTAIARGTSIYTFSPSVSHGDTFAFTFIPEAISTPSTGTGHYHEPFSWANGPSNNDIVPFATGGGGVLTRETMFPNVQFDSIEAMRVVGASITITQTQKLVDRAGYGLVARVYAPPPSDPQNVSPPNVSKSVIINSTYKDEANFSSVGEEDHLRMVYAPADFSDLHMRSTRPKSVDVDNEEYPVIQGFITGYGTTEIAITIEFNVVVEYIPKAVLYQMVERKPAIVDGNHLAKAENLVARTDTGVDPQQ